MTTIEIPEAHGRAIAERKTELDQLRVQFALIAREDKRHVDAVLRAAAHDPAEYAQYDLKVVDGHYYLEMQNKPKEEVQPPVNGAPPPPVEARQAN